RSAAERGAIQLTSQKQHAGDWHSAIGVRAIRVQSGEVMKRLELCAISFHAKDRPISRRAARRGRSVEKIAGKCQSPARRSPIQICARDWIDSREMVKDGKAKPIGLKRKNCSAPALSASGRGPIKNIAGQHQAADWNPAVRIGGAQRVKWRETMK